MSLQNIALNSLVSFGLDGAGTAQRTITNEDGLVSKTIASGPRKQHFHLSTDTISGFVIPAPGAFSFSLPVRIDAYEANDTISVVDSLENPTQKVVAKITAVVGDSLVANTISITGSGTISSGFVIHNRPLGLKVDGAVSQLFYDTEALVAGWTTNNVARAAFAGKTPEGITGSGAVITDTSASLGVLTSPTLSISNNATNFVLSVWAKHGQFQNEGPGINTAELGYLRINSQFGGVAYAQTALFDAENCQIKKLNDTAGFVDVGAEKYPNGWCRFWLVCRTDAASTTVSANFAPGVASSRTQNAAQLFAATTVQNNASFGQHIFWGAMIESGANKTRPSDYVPNLATVAGTVSSKSEFAQIIGENFMRAFNPEVSGTLYIEAVSPGQTGQVGTVAALTDALGNRYLRVYRASALNLVSAEAKEALATVVLDGSGPGEMNSNNWAANSLRKIAFSWDMTQYTLAVDGVLVDQAPVDSALPNGPDRLNIGSLLDVAAGNQGGFLIQKVDGYKSRLTAAQLTTLTA